MNSTDLQNYIDSNGIAAEIVVLADETPTVAAAAAAVGVQPVQIIKSLLFVADGRPFLVVTNGLTRVNRKRLADVLDLSRRRIKIASSEEVADITGYPVGAVPPFGHPQPIPTLLDAGVLEQSVVLGGGGAINALMRMTPRTLQQVTSATIVDVAGQ